MSIRAEATDGATIKIVNRDGKATVEISGFEVFTEDGKEPENKKLVLRACCDVALRIASYTT